ncbi:MAG: translation elongation factor Ts [Candidatus Omnitrophota bacterium]
MAGVLDKVKDLRDKTNAGMMDCKNALTEANGDIEKAIEVLRKKGLSLATKRSSRSAKEGAVASYIHMNGKIGVLLEVNCETDFVARNEQFQGFVKDLTMHIAATNPEYLKREDVPSEVVEKEKEIIKEQCKDKPAKAMDKIVEGKLNSYYKDNCLLEQVFVKDPKVTIKDLLNDIIAKTGENVVVKRYMRYQLGESE